MPTVLKYKKLESNEIFSSIACLFRFIVLRKCLLYFRTKEFFFLPEIFMRLLFSWNPLSQLICLWNLCSCHLCAETLFSSSGESDESTCTSCISLCFCYWNLVRSHGARTAWLGSCLSFPMPCVNKYYYEFSLYQFVYGKPNVVPE